MKICYVLKGNNENPQTRITKKRQQQKKPSVDGIVLAAGFSIKVVRMCTGPKREAPDVVHLAQQ